MKIFENNYEKIIFALLLAVSVVWIIIIPPLQTPDEQAHLRYIQFVAENRRLPSSKDSVEYINSSPSITKLAEEAQAERIFHNSNYHFDFTNKERSEIGNINASHLFNHPPLYYIWGALLYLIFNFLSIGGILYVVRFANLIFVGLNFIFSLKTSKLIFKRKLTQLFATSLVNFWPMFMFINSGVNNDVLLFTSSIAAIYYMIKIVQSSKIKRKDILLLVTWLAIGILTKGHFVMFLPLAGLVLLYKFFTRKWKVKKYLSSFVPAVIPFVYFIRNLIEFETFFPRFSGKTGIVQDNFFKNLQNCKGQGILSYIKVYFYPRFVMVSKGFIGNFGWLDTLYPKLVYMVLGVFFLLGLFIAFYIFLKQIRKKELNKSLVILALAAVFLEIGLGYLYIKSYLNRCYLNFPTQGRYYYPVLLPIMFILVYGINNLLARNTKETLLRLLFVALVTFSSYSFVLIIYRYYL